MFKFLLLFLFSIVLYQGEAKAQTCSATITPLNFGTTNVVANIAYNSTATINYICVGAPLATIRVCTSLGLGSGGSATGSPRTMINGVNTLNYNLYTTSAATNIFGSFLWAFSGSYPGVKDVVTIGSGGTVNFTRVIYGRILAGQTTIVPGNYNSSYSATDVRISYDASSATACTTAPVASASTGFTVSAIVPAACVASATDMNFGSHPNLNAIVDATSSLSVQCTKSTPFTVTLNGGLTGAVLPNLRKMTNNTNSISYGLYGDSARTYALGNTAGSTLVGTGTGALQTRNIFGRIPVQPTPLPGLYTDTITMSVTY